MRALAMPSLLLIALHSVCAVVTVGLFNASPASWPPLYSSPLEAYTLRRFYGHFWHHLMRKAFIMNAAAITTSVLRLRKNTVGLRVCVVMLSFAISGLMHTASGWLPGPCGRWRPLYVCLATGLAILAEQASHAGCVRVHTWLGLPWSRLERTLWYVIRYCWVGFWWLEVLSWSSFAATRCYAKSMVTM